MAIRAREIENFVAQVLSAHGLPAQSCGIQASWLTWAASDLALIITLPLSFTRKGGPTGVIQIGSPKVSWNPEIRILLTDASRWDGLQLRLAVEEHVKDGLAGALRECQRKGVEWPNGWARLEVVGERRLPLKAGGISAESRRVLR